jgi:hypothetical protein
VISAASLREAPNAFHAFNKKGFCELVKQIQGRAKYNPAITNK